MEKVITENRNENTKDIDVISTAEVVKKINDEDKLVALAVEKELQNITRAVDIIVENFKNKGRLFYYGAGTSGRLGVLDASECPPTFGVEADMVQGIIAGGDSALRYAVEGAEDDYMAGFKDGAILSENDTCVLISASGNPKYLMGVANMAQQRGAKIIALTSNPDAKILKVCDVGICIQAGAEPIAGSSRMKSGTAQKMVLNILSTASMVKIGKTYENYMIDVKATNEKLKQRAISIVSELAESDEETALRALEKTDWKVKPAILMVRNDISYSSANKMLEKHGGILRRVLDEQ